MLRFRAFQRQVRSLPKARSFVETAAKGLSGVSKLKQNGRRNLALLVGAGFSAAVVASFSYAIAQEEVNKIKEECTTNKGNNDKQETTSIKNELKKKRKLKRAIAKSLLKLEQVKEETGSPGLVCAISIDGEVVLNAQLGFSDVENGVKCHDGTVMRIASISKALTSIALGKLLQDSKLELDVPIQQYVDYFPEKKFEGEKVVITPRMLMSHTSGVRHYDKKLTEEEADKTNETEAKNPNEKTTNKKDKTSKDENSNAKSCEKSDEFSLKEYFIKDHYKNIKESIGIFKDDPLLKKPGTDYLYTTHGWTLLSACIEKASGIDYVKYMKNICYELGLDNTTVELNDPILYDRSRNYTRDSKGKLQNTAYVDNSYKWAGGGFLSTVGDLLKIGNMMMYSYQNDEGEMTVQGYLSRNTVKQLWTPDPLTIGKVSKAFKDIGYGLGWTILPETAQFGCCRKSKFAAMHGGGAVGASSILLIVPNGPTTSDVTNGQESKDATHQGQSSKDIQNQGSEIMKIEPKPKGVVVAIMVNLQGVGLTKTALEIANNFLLDEAVNSGNL